MRFLLRTTRTRWRIGHAGKEECRGNGSFGPVHPENRALSGCARASEIAQFRRVTRGGTRSVAIGLDEEDAPQVSLAFDTLTQLLYDELHQIAEREYRRAGSPATLQPTALVSEAYIKLQRHAGWH